MWAVRERKKRAFSMADEDREAKVRRTPNDHACARDGCPIKATSQAAIRRCKGPCLEESKPAYCGVECQRLVR